jgi:hypothetical protein
MRVSSRFGMPALVAVGGLAGFGLMRLTEWRGARGPAVHAAVGLAAIALVNVEALRAPMQWEQVREVSRVYRVLAAVPDAVIVEIPFPHPIFRARNSVYLPAATVHWRPMVNGYSGFLPGSYRRLWAAGMDRFPSGESLDALDAVGVTHAVVHYDLLGRRRDRIIAALEKSGRAERLVEDGPVRLYRLRSHGG